MSDARPIAVIEGRLGRSVSNALTMELRDGSAAPIATARQAAAESAGKRLGVLLGFRNGGSGTHVVQLGSGAERRVVSPKSGPTRITDDQGAVLASVELGEPTVARRGEAGPPLFHVVDDPARPKSTEAFNAVVTRPDGERVAGLAVIRTLAGWSLARDLIESQITFHGVAAPLKLPVLGTVLALDAPIDGFETEVLVAMCVDLAISLRPYVPSMR